MVIVVMGVVVGVLVGVVVGASIRIRIRIRRRNASVYRILPLLDDGPFQILLRGGRIDNKFLLLGIVTYISILARPIHPSRIRQKVISDTMHYRAQYWIMLHPHGGGGGGSSSSSSSSFGY